MNILPKKRWHVRTKENIARVRKDEAEAAVKERQEIIRTENADREARLSILKHKSKERLKHSGYADIEIKYSSFSSEPQHINLFENLECAVKTTNKEHDKEVKDKKEDYEKKIGYLTYLGQDTNEALKKKNWYEVLPEESRFRRSSTVKDTHDKLVLKDEDGKSKSNDIDEKNSEIAWRAKQKLDPINSFKSYCHRDNITKPNKDDKSKISSYNIQISYDHGDDQRSRHKKKTKKYKEDKTEKERKLQNLRHARLKREQQERFRTQLFLSGHHRSTVTTEEHEKISHRVKAKYNSQFNPELARQNYR